MIKIFNKEGLELLSETPDNSINLILTDPPYITSRKTGMDKWVQHIAKQDKAVSSYAAMAPEAQEEAKNPNVKTEEQWLQYKTLWEWLSWFHAGGIDTIDKKTIKGKILPPLKRMKQDYIKYGSIYGKKYAVTTQYGAWDEDFTLEKLNLFVHHFHRVLKPGGTCIIFFDLWKLSYLKEQLESVKFKQHRFIEWIKTNPQPINSQRNYLTNCREIALLAVKGAKPTFNSSYDKGIYDKGIYEYPIYGGKDRFHPTQKSLPLFEDLIVKHSNEGDIVLDCFLGSGTTAVAALNTNRKFIGCELEKDYFEKSLKRINRLALKHKDLKLKESVV
jgi:site-specific DNA-methyltransferase (adenine-specific)